MILDFDDDLIASVIAVVVVDEYRRFVDRIDSMADNSVVWVLDVSLPLMNNSKSAIEYQNLGHSNRHVKTYATMVVMSMNDLDEVDDQLVVDVVHLEMIHSVVDFRIVFDRDDRMIEFHLYLFDIHKLIVYYESMLIHLFCIQLTIDRVLMVDRVYPANEVYIHWNEYISFVYIFVL